MLEKLKRNYVLIFSLIVFLIMLIKHLNVELGTGDDIWFLDIAQKTNLIEYLTMRYSTWTSRLIIEAIMLILLQLPSLVWIVLDSLIFVLAYYAIIKILNGKDKLWINVVAIIMFLSFSFNYFGSAGWYATTINYAWPLAFGLYALSFIPSFCVSKEIRKIDYFLLGFSLFLSTNQEQMCALIFGFYFVALLYQYISNKKINRRLLGVMLFCLVSLLFHVTCPGNGSRTIAETAAYYPYYENYGLMDKIVLGCLSTFSFLINQKEYIVILFLLIISYLGLKSKKIVVGFISVIPILSFLIARISLRYSGTGSLSQMINRFMNPMNAIPYDFLTGIYIIIILIEAGCIIYVMHKVLDFDIFIFTIIIVLAAFASRFILGFSPSSFGSGARTFINMYMLLLIADIVMLFKIKPQLSVKGGK